MKRESAAAFSVLIALLLIGVAAASARAETVVLVNRAQPGIESTVPQSPLDLMVRGDCAFARTIDEARGGSSPCPAGTWVPPGGDWSPTVNVAAGDRLELSFPVAQESVAVVGTSNYPVGLTDPNGMQVQNESLGAFSVTPAADPRVWAATVPGLDSRARFEGFSAIAVTARGRDGSARNVGFRLQTPRNVDEGTRCGRAFYSASEPGYHCPGGGIPPGGGRPPTPGPTPTAPPSLGLTPPATAAQATVKVTSARIDAACSSMRMVVTPSRPGALGFRASIAGRTVARWTRTVQASVTRRMQLPLSRATRNRIRRSARTSIALTVSTNSRVLTRRAIATRACKPNRRR